MKSERHEELLYQEIRRLEAEGWRVVTIGRTQPDAIAISPDRETIVAIEVLGRRKKTDAKGRSKGYIWDGGKSAITKKRLYTRFDDITFILFDRGGSDWQQRLVASEEWPEEMKYNRDWWKEFEDAKRVKYSAPNNPT